MLFLPQAPKLYEFIHIPNLFVLIGTVIIVSIFLHVSFFHNENER